MESSMAVMNTANLPPLILGLPAMGVPASFYNPFAEALATTIGAVVEFADMPGQGQRVDRARAGANFGYREIVETEIPDWVSRRRAEHPGRPILLLGHSLGGQLALLASATLRDRIDGLVLIAAGTAHWRTWPSGQRGRAWVTVQAIRAVSTLWPWYPGRLVGFGGDQPRRLMRDWSHNATTGRYRLEGSVRSIDEIEGELRAVTLPVLLVGVHDDPIAPVGARDELMARLPGARVTRVQIDGVRRDSPWRRHFSWARAPADTTQVIARWLADMHSPHPSFTHPIPKSGSQKGKSHVLA